MTSQAVSSRYAWALGDVVKSDAEGRAIMAELDEWADIVEGNSQLQEALTNPTIPYDRKQRVLKELIAVSEVKQITGNFLRVLLKNQRLRDLRRINQRFQELLDERAGIVAATVISAKPIAEPVRKSLEKELAALAGKKVRVDFEVDDSLIGGLVAQIGSKVYDGSVKTQLELVKEKLAGGRA